MHIHTHVVCNAQDLNFKFKLKLGRVKLTQVLVSSSILSMTKIKFSCESLSTSIFYSNSYIPKKRNYSNLDCSYY